MVHPKNKTSFILPHAFSYGLLSSAIPTQWKWTVIYTNKLEREQQKHHKRSPYDSSHDSFKKVTDW